jgi:hypothetical protein
VEDSAGERTRTKRSQVHGDVILAGEDAGGAGHAAEAVGLLMENGEDGAVPEDAIYGIRSGCAGDVAGGAAITAGEVFLRGAA